MLSPLPTGSGTMAADDDSDDASPPFVSTQLYGGDDDDDGYAHLDLDEALRKRRVKHQRERAAEQERRRMEMRRSRDQEVEEDDDDDGEQRKRRMTRTNDLRISAGRNNVDGASSDGGGSVDLLAEEDDDDDNDDYDEKMRSEPKTTRISNRVRRKSSSSSEGSVKDYHLSRRNTSLSSTTKKNSVSSPSTILRRGGDFGGIGGSVPSSPRNRVAFSALGYNKINAEDKNDETTNNVKRTSRTKNDYSSSDDGNDKQRRRTSLSSSSRGETKNAALARRLGAGSSSSESDDDEAMLKVMRARQAKAAAVSAAAPTASEPSRFATASSSLSFGNGRIAAAAAAATNTGSNDVRSRGLAANSTQKRRVGGAGSSSDSDDDGGEAMLKAMRARQAREEAEAEEERRLRSVRNPLGLERREREEMERVRDERMVTKMTTTTRAGAGGLEGTEILIGGDNDDAEAKSVSELGDRASPRRPYNGRLGSDGVDNDDVDTPSKRRRTSDKQIVEADEDGLWSDEKEKIDSHDDESDDGRNRKRGRSRPRDQTKRPGPKATSKARSTAADESDDDSMPKQNKKEPALKEKSRRPPKSIVNSKDNADESKKRSGGNGSRLASRYEIEDDEKSDLSYDEGNRLANALKPEFSDPKMGDPGPLVPFVLSKTWVRGQPLIGYEDEADDGNEDDQKMPAVIAHEESNDQVPASINRYLKGYQRTGIQFVYSSVIKGKGCVLGDDMGLGKTIQMISLIAALLKKKGNGLDLFEIKRHSNKVKKALQAREDSRRQALLTGFGLTSASEIEAKEAAEFAPILIIVPSSVVENWHNEFNTWGHFNVGLYSGPAREKSLNRIKDRLDVILIVGKSLFSRAGDYDPIASVDWKVSVGYYLLLATYTQHSQWVTPRNTPTGFCEQLVIVDEFHEFKNGKSQAYMRLADLRDNLQCPVVGMTGTLMQNRHDELYYLMDLVRPGVLGDWDTFSTEISKPITYARAKDAKEKVTLLAQQCEQLLREKIKPAYLERKKEDVLKNELTKKRENVIFCELTEVQKKIYRHMISLPDYQHLRFSNAPCDCGINRQYFLGYKKLKTHKEQLQYQRRHKNELVPKKKCCYKYPWNPRREEPGEPQIDPDAILWIHQHDKIIANPDEIEEDIIDDKYIVCKTCPSCTTLAAMQKLWKVAAHPCLLQVDHCETGIAAKRKLEFARVALPPDVLRELPGGSFWKCDSIMDDHMRLSGKMKTLDYLLRRYLRKTDRVLVFSHSTMCLDVIQSHIKCQGWSNIRLDGQTPTSHRQSLVDQFQRGDVEIFLISTKAGGLGLNLTAANRVIIFDASWNPSCDIQAQDRAFRLGQKRNVEVVRLIARGTIEELMYARQVYKTQLTKQTLGQNTEGQNQPQIFRGVANDPNRKGELFGIENLMKFKDGSFMSTLWKASANPNEGHDVAELEEKLENFDDDKLYELAEEGEDPLTKKRHSNGAENGSVDGSDDEFEGNGMNHGDLFSNTKGGARVAKDDSDFEDEMGGQSQIVAVATKLACEDISDEEEEDDDDATPTDYVPPDVKPAASSAKSEKVAADAPPDEKVAADSLDKNIDTLRSSPDGPAVKPSYDTIDEMSPDRSTCSQDKLRTQPTQTPKQKASTKVAKISLMGTAFETSTKTNDDHPATKSSGLYIPSYAKK